MSTPNIQATTTQPKSQIVVFRLGLEEYAMSIAQIKEVVKTPAITPMPQSPRHIRGVANIRGNIIAIVDLEERFSIAERTTSAENGGNYTLVIESDDLKMGVLVRDVPNTLSVEDGAIDRTILNADEQSYIKGIVKINQRLIILIDIFSAMSHKDLVQRSAAA